MRGPLFNRFFSGTRLTNPSPLAMRTGTMLIGTFSAAAVYQMYQRQFGVPYATA